MLYTFTFIARQRGALGIRSQYTATVEADSYEVANLLLYNTYEHIDVLHHTAKEAEHA